MPIAVQNVDTLNDARYHYCMAAMTAGLMVARRETTTDIAALLVHTCGSHCVDQKLGGGWVVASVVLASFPGLPTTQFLIVCSM